jgi:hypothetical protein
MDNKNEEKKGGSDIVEFLGLPVNVNKISNPHLQKVVVDSRETGYKFYIQWTQWMRYNDYGDYYDRNGRHK